MVSPVFVATKGIFTSPAVVAWFAICQAQSSDASCQECRPDATGAASSRATVPSFARRMLQQDKLPFFGPPYLRVRLSVSVCLGLSVCPCERCSKTSVKMHQNLITWIRSKRWMYLLHQISSEENHPQAKNVFESRRLVFKITTFDFSCAEYVNNKFLHVSNPFTLFLTIYQCSWPHAALLSHFLVAQENGRPHQTPRPVSDIACTKHMHTRFFHCHLLQAT